MVKKNAVLCHTLKTIIFFKEFFMRKLAALLSLLLLLSAGTALADESKVIQAASDPWAPFIDPRSPGEGLSMEIIREAYATQGYRVKLDYVPWARAEKGVGAGVYDILPPTWRTGQRERVFLFSKPYARNRIVFIKLKDDPFEYNGHESLKGKRIGTVRGYGYNNRFYDDGSYEVEAVNNFETNVNKLLAGRIDLTLEDEMVARVKIAAMDPNLLEKIAFTKRPLCERDLHVASGLRHPRHQEFIRAFNKGLEIIRKNGTYKRIMDKHGVDPTSRIAIDQ